jgi:hypothetical protein
LDAAEDPLADRLRASHRLEDAPEAVIQNALALWKKAEVPVAEPASAPGAALRRLAAALRFDSATASPLALGLRSGGLPAPGASTRQLLYFSEGRDIDVRIAPVNGPGARQWQVSGQVLGPDATGMAELRCGAHTRTASWSDLAEFSFTDVAPGSCTLVLRGGDWELELPPFEVPG